MRTVPAFIVGALLLGACPAYAQSLPGPAGAGWFVVMGIPYQWGDPEAMARMSGGQRLSSEEFNARWLEVNRAAGRACKALVVTADAADSPIFNRNWSIKVTKRFGPYTNQQSAEAALRSAGWSYSHGNEFFANAGC